MFFEPIHLSRFVWIISAVFWSPNDLLTSSLFLILHPLLTHMVPIISISQYLGLFSLMMLDVGELKALMIICRRMLKQLHGSEQLYQKHLTVVKLFHPLLSDNSIGCRLSTYKTALRRADQPWVPCFLAFWHDGSKDLLSDRKQADDSNRFIHL